MEDMNDGVLSFITRDGTVTVIEATDILGVVHTGTAAYTVVGDPVKDERGTVLKVSGKGKALMLRDDSVITMIVDPDKDLELVEDSP